MPEEREAILLFDVNKSPAMETINKYQTDWIPVYSEGLASTKAGCWLRLPYTAPQKEHLENFLTPVVVTV